MVDTGFDEERVFESREYQFSMDMLADSKLRGNQMYEKLTQRLSAFYLNTEKIRINGLTEAQEETIRKSGFSQQYRVKLYKSLRDLMIHIVNERKLDLKLRQLRQTYEWFIGKLIAMGALSEAEQRREEEFLNPLTNQVANVMSAVIKQKVRSALCDVDKVDAYNKAMYHGTRVVYDKDSKEIEVESAARTHHGDIQPSAIRIQGYKHKSFGKKITDAVDAVKKKDHELTVLSKTKEGNHGLMTAQLGSVYDIPIDQA